MSLLQYSMFQDVFFPTGESDGEGKAGGGDLQLQKLVRYAPTLATDIRSTLLVFFDLETTGLDDALDEIVEIGAQKYLGGELVGEWSTLVCPKQVISAQASKISGITQEMLHGQPSIETVLPQFLQWMQGGILVAHNATFDIGFVREAGLRLGMGIEWPVLCTLKMARSLLPALERKNLDTLAQYYGLQFEARHRSIGDVKVTAEVFHRLLEKEAEDLETWQDFQEYRVL